MERSSSFILSSIRYRHAGFTLFEALIALTIIVLVASLAVPLIRNVLLSNRMVTQVNTVIADLALARSEAIKRGTYVTLCQSSSGAGCTGASTWHEGYIVFADPNENHKVDAGETIVRVQTKVAKFAEYDGSLDLNHYISYKPTGMAFPNGSFTFCDERGARGARSIIVYSTGRARTSNKKADGTALVCPS